MAASSLDGLSLQSLAGSASAEDENTIHANEIIKNFKDIPGLSSHTLLERD
jgi:hypothetical protein